jgi:hypothetical protein
VRPSRDTIREVVGAHSARVLGLDELQPQLPEVHKGVAPAPPGRPAAHVHAVEPVHRFLTRNHMSRTPPYGGEHPGGIIGMVASPPAVLGYRQAGAATVRPRTRFLSISRATSPVALTSSMKARRY